MDGLKVFLLVTGTILFINVIVFRKRELTRTKVVMEYLTRALILSSIIILFVKSTMFGELISGMKNVRFTADQLSRAIIHAIPLFVATAVVTAFKDYGKYKRQEELEK